MPPLPKETAALTPEPQRVLVVASDRLDDLRASFEHAGHVERWLLPSADGRALTGEFADLLRERAGSVRLFVRDTQVKLLRRWRSVVAHPAVRIVLFEGTSEMSTSLNLLNSLGARAMLDVTAICRSQHGGAQLGHAFRRYLTDPMWKIEVNPFAAMLRAGLERREAPWLNRWLLPPAGFQLSLAAGIEGRGSPYALEVVNELALEAKAGASRWSEEHAACAVCRLRPICGGQLSARAGLSCSSDELAYVQRIHEEADKLRKQLRPDAAR